MSKVDEVIIGGGNMIMDITSVWPRLLYDYVRIAKKMGKRVKIVFVGVGPLNFKNNIVIVNKILESVDFISVRDDRSKRILNEISPSKVINKTIDPVFLENFISKEDRIKANSISIQTKQIKIGVCILSGVCFYTEEKFQEYRLGIEKIIKNLYNLDNSVRITLFSTEKMDYTAIEDIYIYLCNSKIPIEICMINSFEDIKKLYLDLNFLIGGRMHSLILGQKFLLPSIGFVWQDKLVSYAEITNSKKYMYTIEELANSSKKIASDVLINLNDLDNIYKIYENNLGFKKEILSGTG